MDWIVSSQRTVNPNFIFAVEIRESGEFIGLIAVNCGKKKFRGAEIWYKFHFSHWNKGYATETLKTVISFGFDQLKLHRIEAGCAVDNIRAIKH